MNAATPTSDVEAIFNREIADAEADQTSTFVAWLERLRDEVVAAQLAVATSDVEAVLARLQRERDEALDLLSKRTAEKWAAEDALAAALRDAPQPEEEWGLVVVTRDGKTLLPEHEICKTREQAEERARQERSFGMTCFVASRRVAAWEWVETEARDA